MNTKLLSKSKKQRLGKSITVPVLDEYKDIYDMLSKDDTHAAEHMRQVIYPELIRLRKLKYGDAG
jgi:DNA-binding FadR family transcriptional regulator